MNNKIQNIFQPLIPFLILGIVLSLAVALFIMFSYVLLWGIFVGCIFWVISLIKQFFFSPKITAPEDNKRIIEHNDQD